jgi:YVTN family beta-propeller protein
MFLSAAVLVFAVAIVPNLLPESDGAPANGAVAVAAEPTSAPLTAAEHSTRASEPAADVSTASLALADAAREIQAQIAALIVAAQAVVEQDPPNASIHAGVPKVKREKPSNKRKLKLVKTITGGGLSPKSIVADQNGQIFTMNMMYNHNITVFNKAYKRKKVIDDTINLAKFGYKQYSAKARGAPVEAAVSPDGSRIYVSNYTMYGPEFPNQGFDLCTPRDRIDRGFVYVINTKSLRKVDAIQVGEVPKYLAITPDGRYMLVGNWCSWDISVVDLRKNKEIHRIDAGVAPRGIAYSPNGKTAYVTLVGEHRILVIDMQTFKVKRSINGLGKRPRHLVMSPGGRYLYITVQGEDKPGRADGRILKYDTRKRKVVARSQPLVEPRTTVMADDGKSLYVVDYHPGTIVKLNAKNLRTLDSKYLGYHPIGVTYDNDSNKVWVAGYGGSVWVLKDK